MALVIKLILQVYSIMKFKSQLNNIIVCLTLTILGVFPAL